MSLAQESYIASQSLRVTSRQLFIVFAGLIGYTMLGIVFLYTGAIGLAKFWLPYTIILISIVLIYMYLKARGFYKIQKDWVRDFVESQYILIVNTSMPSGNSTSEKLFNLCKLVFPELREDYARYTTYWVDQLKGYFRKLRGQKLIDFSKGTNLKVSSSYTLDLAIKTVEGYFIIMDFKDKKVTLDKLKELKDIINRRKFRDSYYRLNVFRVICVGKNYDDSFLSPEGIAENIRKLGFNFKIDLLIEENVGFSTLWIS
jgi:hypothetical protein